MKLRQLNQFVLGNKLEQKLDLTVTRVILLSTGLRVHTNRFIVQDSAVMFNIQL